MKWRRLYDESIYEAYGPRGSHIATIMQDDSFGWWEITKMRSTMDKRHRLHPTLKEAKRAVEAYVDGVLITVPKKVKKPDWTVYNTNTAKYVLHGFDGRYTTLCNEPVGVGWKMRFEKSPV